MPHNFVLNELRLLAENTNNDILSIDTKLLKYSYDIISLLLTKVFNASLLNGTIPDDFKKARVTPVYKGKGPKEDFSNFRPISIVSHVAKILEKFVNIHLTSYLRSNNMLSNNQSAFLSNHSTTTSLHKVHNHLLQCMNDGKLIGVCSLDIRKCFDTISHELLLSKLRKYGISDNEYAWFVAICLIEPKPQYVMVNWMDIFQLYLVFPRAQC